MPASSPAPRSADDTGLTTPDVALGGLPDRYTAGFAFSRLSRDPLPTSRERQAHDAADLLVLDTLAGWEALGRTTGRVAVLHDRHGALALPLLAAGHDVALGVDEASAAASVTGNLERMEGADTWGRLRLGAVDEQTLSGADTVLMTLPRSLDALRLTAARIARWAAEDVLVLAAGRDKHMSPSMNTVLADCFTRVVPGRGRAKSRVLTAAGPRRDARLPEPESRTHRLAGLGELILVGGAATFGGAALDPGSRLLAETLAAERPPVPEPTGTSTVTDSGLPVRIPWSPVPGVPEVVDAGSGNGTLSVVAARLWPEVSVLASDQSADAVASSRATAAANGLADRIRVRQDDALSALPDASVCLVLLNPPFHDGTAVDPTVAHRMIAAAGRVLAPGGQLWCVWNSHLQHRAVLQREVGPTRQAARDRTFTVTVSTRA